MTTRVNNVKIIAVIATALLVLSLTGTGLYYRSNGLLKKSLDGERLNSETLLSEKLALQKEAIKLKHDIAFWRSKSEAADRLLNRAPYPGDDLVTAEDELMITGLTDDLWAESQKRPKQQKLIVSGAKSKKLTMRFEIPQSLSNDVRFSVTTPTGRIVRSGDKSLTYNWVADDRPMTASLSPYSGEFEVSRGMEMVYAPEQELAIGIYKIRVYTGELYAGGCQVKLN